MASTLPGLRRIAACGARSRRTFHTTSRTFINIGDTLPSVDVAENSPGNKINLSQQIGKKALIIGVPAAFSPSCSDTHIPGFIHHKNLKSAGDVFVVAVNDAFVTKAWGQSLDPNGDSGVRFLADPSADFTKALDLAFDGSAIFGGPRSKRYALEIENGKVKSLFVEPDSTGVNVSTAEKVLG